VDNTNIPIIGSLLAAISWLAKRLYDAPRPADYAEVIKERDNLRAIINEAAAEARRLLVDREAENRLLRDEIAALHAAVDRAKDGADATK
jgi:hypothetical protein